MSWSATTAFTSIADNLLRKASFRISVKWPDLLTKHTPGLRLNGPFPFPSLTGGVLHDEHLSCKSFFVPKTVNAPTANVNPLIL